VEGLKSMSKVGIEANQKPALIKPPAPTNEEEVRAKFTAIMIDERYTTRMGLFERARHRMLLGDERPRTKKQVAPCPLCEDLF
jgi:hypothetical protein